MSTAKNKRGVSIGPLIIIILLIGVVAGGVTLHFLNRNLNTAIKQKEQQLIQLQQEIRAYQNLRSGKQVIKTEHKRLVGFIPSRENQEEFIWELGKLAQENNLNISDCVFDSKLLTLKALPKYQAIQCQVSLSGSYQNLLGFIDSLPRIARLVLISKMNFKQITRGNNGESPQLEMTLTLDLIASATQVAFSQTSSATSTPVAAPSRKAPLVKTPPVKTALNKAPVTAKNSNIVKKQGTKSTQSPSTTKRPSATRPLTTQNTGVPEGSPLEVKNPPILNPGE